MNKLGTFILFIVVVLSVYTAVAIYIEQFQEIQEARELATNYKSPYVAQIGR